MEHNLIPTIADVSSFSRFSNAALEAKVSKPVRYHIKIDTGMGRVGLLPQSLSSFLNFMSEARHSSPLVLEGAFTHFSKADEIDKSHTISQVKVFEQCVKALKEAGFEPPMIHAANSAGIIDSHLLHEEDLVKVSNTVRLGISLYGFYPSHDVDKSAINQLCPVLSWKTRIVQLKELAPGHTISYGGEFVTAHSPHTLVATLPVGYADGYRRRLGRYKSPRKPAFHVLVGGEPAPLIGRVCMDMIHVDVTHVNGVAPGAEVVLIGKQGIHEIPGDALAVKLKTINYEITCGVGKRVPRVYTRHGKTVAVSSLLGDVVAPEWANASSL